MRDIAISCEGEADRWWRVGEIDKIWTINDHWSVQPLHCTPWCAIYSDLKNIKKCNKIQCKVHSYKVVKNAMQFMDNTKCIAVNCTELCSAVLILHWNVKIDRCTGHFTVHFSAFYSAIWCSFNIALKCELWSVHRVSSHAPNLASGQCGCHDDDWS